MAEENNDHTILDNMKGAFAKSLVRNNKKIKEDRAIAISESAEMIYKRMVEDLEVEIKQLKRNREAMLDMSPRTTDSLELAADFNAAEFVAKDIKLGIDIRNLEIKIEIARERYNHLFKEAN
ncbi:MAG TPA: hypothetical protein PLB89_04980 [Flavobacteriales bacterium]|nr:hypothetical protein [Flavobacteriales bacterium]